MALRTLLTLGSVPPTLRTFANDPISSSRSSQPETLIAVVALVSAFRQLKRLTSCSYSPSDCSFCEARPLFVMSVPSQSREMDRKQVTSTRSYKLPVLFVCAILGYALWQLDLYTGTSGDAESELSVSSSLKNGKGDEKKPILQISILGERNSGTRWTWG